MYVIQIPLKQSAILFVSQTPPAHLKLAAGSPHALFHVIRAVGLFEKVTI